MEKILVEVFLPASGQTYDVYIPLGSKMSEVVYIISHLMSDLSKGTYQCCEDAILCDSDTGMIFNINLSIYELGLRNGSRLMLI